MSYINKIGFPNLGIELSLHTSFTIGPLTIRWYGVIIALGFALATLYCSKRSTKFGVSQDNFIDMILVAVPIAIIGARAYYVIFNPKQFKSFWDIFKIWEGGVAIYGAVIASVIAVYVFTRIKKINTLNLLDLAMPGLLIGQAIGRWGNFINGEAYGQITSETLPWGMAISHYNASGGFLGSAAGGALVHPFFLYESLWNIAGFLLLHFTSKKRAFYGQSFFLYIIWYGVGRGFLEGIRGEDTLMFFDTGIRVSQALGFLSALAAFVFLVYKLFFSVKGDPILLLSNAEAAEVLEQERAAKEATRSAKSAKSGEEAEKDDEIEADEGEDGVEEENEEDESTEEDISSLEDLESDITEKTDSQDEDEPEEDAEDEEGNDIE